VLNHGFKQRDIVKCELIFIACCVLHNFLLDQMVRNHVRAGHGYPMNNNDCGWMVIQLMLIIMQPIGCCRSNLE
jgi:hypothetical protein